MKVHTAWREIRFGVGRMDSMLVIPRHQHLEAYATVVLAGSYEQASYAGRLRVEPGDVLIQPTLDFHSDIMLSSDICIVRLPWERDSSFGGVYRGAATDLILRVAGRDPFEAALLLKQQLAGKPCLASMIEDWSDKLATDLRSAPNLGLIGWADSNGLTREHVWRCFNRDFGVSPLQFRSEIRARNAWLALTGSEDSLSGIAADLGFSDQAHMTRAVTALTGAPPARWRNRMRSVRQNH